MELKKLLSESLLDKRANVVLDAIMDKVKTMAVSSGKRTFMPRSFEVVAEGENLRVTILPLFANIPGAKQIAGFSFKKNFQHNILMAWLYKKENIKQFQTVLYHEIIHFLEAIDSSTRIRKPIGKGGGHGWSNNAEFNAYIHTLHKASIDHKEEWNKIISYRGIIDFSEKYTPKGSIPVYMWKDKDFTKRFLSRIARENFIPKIFQKESPGVKIKSVPVTFDEMVKFVNELPVYSKANKKRVIELLKKRGNR